MNIKSNEATNKLRAALSSCQTLKTLKDRYPELERFFPDYLLKPSVVLNVPAVQNVLGDFKSLGLPMSSPVESL
jgi:hypothetical protein